VALNTHCTGTQDRRFGPKQSSYALRF
jgi:hypothetical protein